MTDQVIKQANVFATLLKLHFLDVLCVTHRGGPSARQLLLRPRPGAGSSACEQASGPVWKVDWS